MNAVADRIIIQHTNQELITKQDQRRQKTSRKGQEKAKLLTVGKERELVEENMQKDKALANKNARYNVLNWKVKFAKIAWKEFAMESNIFT